MPPKHLKYLMLSSNEQVLMQHMWSDGLNGENRLPIMSTILCDSQSYPPFCSAE